MDKKNKIIFSVVILAALIGYLTFSGTGNSLSTYVEVSELKNGDYQGQMISVNGTVVNNSLTWDPEKTELRFKLTDNSDTVDVYYKGNLPNNIKSDIPVVVQGQYSDELLTARNILVKCPSKYESTIEQ